MISRGHRLHVPTRWIASPGSAAAPDQNPESSYNEGDALMNDRPEDERRGDDAGTRRPAHDPYRQPDRQPDRQPGMERSRDTPPDAPLADERDPEAWADDITEDRDGSDSIPESPTMTAGSIRADHPEARTEEPDPLERPLDGEFSSLSPSSGPAPQSTPSWTSVRDSDSPRPETLPDAETTDAGDTNLPFGFSSERVYNDPSAEPEESPGSRLIRVEGSSDAADAAPFQGRSDDADSTKGGGLSGNIDSAREAITTKRSSPADSDDPAEQSSGATFLDVEDRRADATSSTSDSIDDDEPFSVTSSGDAAKTSRGAGFLGSIGAAVDSAREAITSKASPVTDSDTEPADTPTATSESRADGLLARFRGEPGDLLDPSLRAATTVPQRMVLAGGALAIFLSLLSNNAGLALIVASAIVPVSIALTLNQRDLFERESTLAICAVGAAGLVVGVVVSLVSSWIASSNWFSYGTLNYGAAGFGGRFANLAGTAPFSVWLLTGLLLPLLGLAAVVALPIAMRRWPQYRNEVMDGVILCGTSAGGFAIGTAIVYWAPMVPASGPQTDVADWTLTTLGVALLRPIVITLAGAMLGAGIWKYASTRTLTALFLPLLGSVGGMLLLSLGSLEFQPSGLWSEVVWTALVAIASFMIYRLVLNAAIASDRSVVGEHQARVVCPSCRRITPAGAFCAHCGSALEQDPAQAPPAWQAP